MIVFQRNPTRLRMIHSAESSRKWKRRSAQGGERRIGNRTVGKAQGIGIASNDPRGIGSHALAAGEL
jgi:hypothetical protein